MSKLEYNWPILITPNVRSFLQLILQKKRLQHAYLFVGPPGSNKKSAAKLFAQSLLCRLNESVEDQTNKTYPCGNCRHCLQFSKSVHPDIYEMNKNSSDQDITIDQTRELIEKLSLKSFISKYKIVLVYEAQFFNESSANAFLKTLEEPKGKTIFILVSTGLTFLPDTIVSRCQVIKFGSVSKLEVNKFYQDQGYKKAEIDKAYRLSGGQPEVLEIFLKNNEYMELAEQKIKEKIKMLNQPSLQQLVKGKEDLAKLKTYNEKLDFLKNEISEWQLVFRNLLTAKIGQLHLLIGPQTATTWEKSAFRFTYWGLIRKIEWLLRQQKHLDTNPQPDLLMDNIILVINS